MAYNTKIPLFRRWVLQNFPFIEQDFDALTDYQLICKVVEYLNKVIDTVNAGGEQIELLTNTVNQFVDYINHYFDNLDVQNEINNKLDEMVEDGTLQEIITTYIQANTPWTFNTVADMKLAENFIDGSYAQTLGYHSYNDGGASLYKIRTITSSDVVDEATIIALHDNTLIAELIVTDTINPEQFGAYGDNVHDDTTAVQACLSNTTYLHSVLSKQYKITTPLSVPSYKIVDGGGSIHSTSSCFEIDGVSHITIRDLRLYPVTNAIHIFSTSNHVNYNLFENLHCEGDDTANSKGLFIEVTSDYINECTYRNCVFWHFNYGYYAINESANKEMAKHSFYNCSSETSTVAGQYIKKGVNFSFIECRHDETISNKWITEDTCTGLLIIGGTTWFNTITNANFSSSTQGEIIGRLRFTGISNDSAIRNAYIVNGVVIPVEDALYATRINVGEDKTIRYGLDPLYRYFNFNAQSDVTLTLPSECFGGYGKINSFMVRAARNDHTYTVKVGTDFTKVLPQGTHVYRFTFNPTEGGLGWIAEQLV